MFEYQVFDAKSASIAQTKINELAKQGWRVISVIPWAYATTMIVVTMEREIKV